MAALSRLCGSKIGLAAACLWMLLPRTAAASSPLVLVENVGAGGHVMDFDVARVMYVDAAGAISVRDRASGGVTVLETGTDAGTPTAAGHLSSAGAIWSGGDWVNGTITLRTGYGLMSAKGDWACGFTSADVWRENLATGAISHYAPPSGGSYPFWGKYCDITPSGVLRYDVYGPGTSFNYATVTLAGQTSYSTGDYYAPTGDDATVVAVHHWLNMRGDIRIVAGAVTTTVGATSLGLQQAVPGGDWANRDGWVVYRNYNGTAFEAWTRSPAGVLARVGTITGVASVDAVNGLGEAVFTAGSNQYLGAAGAGAPLALGTYGMSMRYVGGSWYGIAGPNVYKVETSSASLADAGADAAAGSDAGPSDAGADAATADAGAQDGSTTSNSEDTPEDQGSSGSSDGGSAENHGDDDGAAIHGGCATSGGATPSGAALGALLALLVAAVRRARVTKRNSRRAVWRSRSRS